MKKLLIIALVLAPSFVAAQSASVGVSTTIRAALTITAADSLVFGQVANEAVVSIAATDGTAANAGSEAKRGKVTTSAATPIVYTVPATIVLDRQAPSVVGALTLTVSLSYAIKEASSSAYISGQSTLAASSDDNTLWIGGSFTAPTAASNGNVYSGAITVTAVYL